MSLTSRLSLRYLLLLVLLFRSPTIMLIDLLACWNGAIGVACLRRGRQVALLAIILRLVAVISPIVAAIVVKVAMSVITTVVVVAT
jgi:hypothetical protein